MDDHVGLDAIHSMWPTGFTHGRNHRPPRTSSSSRLTPGYVVGSRTITWHECLQGCIGGWEIRHHVGLPTKAQAGDGADGPEPAVQRRRDRRDVCGGRQAGMEGTDTGETKPWWQWRHRSTTKPSGGFACAASPPPLSRDREWSRMGGKATRGWRHSGTNTRTK